MVKLSWFNWAWRTIQTFKRSIMLSDIYIYLILFQFLVNFSINSEFTFNTHSWLWWFISAFYSKQNIHQNIYFFTFKWLSFSASLYYFDKRIKNILLKYNYCNQKQKLHNWKRFPTCQSLFFISWGEMASHDLLCCWLQIPIWASGYLEAITHNGL